MAEKGILRCHLSEIMGERKLRIVDVMNQTGVGRFQVSRLYHEQKMEAITLGTLVKLAEGLGVTLGELVSYEPDSAQEKS